MTGIVFDVQRFCTHDGPGIRTVVFLKGCPLRCPWCHNPESQSAAPSLKFSSQLCVFCRRCVQICRQEAHRIDETAHTLDRSRCISCLSCAETCPSGALEAVGRPWTVDRVMNEVDRDRVFYEESGGGITLSGGEPMSQFEFTRSVLHRCRAAGLHTCVETCGIAPADQWREIAPLVDLFLWDLKHTDERQHEALTGAPLSSVVQNLQLVDAAGARSRLRCILLDGLNSNAGHLDGIARVFGHLTHCEGIDLLPFHPLGSAKRESLGLPDPPSRNWEPDGRSVDQAVGYLHENWGVAANVP